MSVIVTAARTTFARRANGNANMRGTSFTAPAQLYLALWTLDPGPDLTAGGAELSGLAYARQALPFHAPTTVSSGTSQQGELFASSGTITFPTATGAWASAAGFVLYDAVSGGNAWYHGSWAAALGVSNGQALSIADSAIGITEY